MSEDGTAAALDRAAFERALLQGLLSAGVVCPAEQVDRLWRHYLLMVDANRRFNLTRITQPADAAVKHYADSLSLLALKSIRNDSALRVLDVGTGAGLPAIPLAVVCPAWRILAIDGTAKKVRFVTEAAEELGLNNLEARHVRAAELAKTHAGAFDAVVMRAVSTMAVGIRDAGNMVRSGGLLVFYKTPQMPGDEWEEGLQAARAWGLEQAECKDFTLEGGTEVVRRRLIALTRRQGIKR